MLLLPVTIWAEDYVEFDFSSSSQDEVVPTTMERDGVTLKFSVRPEKTSSFDDIIERKSSYLKFKNNGLLTVEGNNCVITSIVFAVSDFHHILKLYNDVGKLKGSRIGSKDYKQEWKGRTYSTSFTSANSGSVNIKSIKVFYEKIQPKCVSIVISSAERATLYYSDKTFIIPKGVIARTYKITDYVLSQSKEYKEGNVLPKGTAVVLEAKEGKYFFEETSKAGVTDPDNALRGSDFKTMTTGGDVYYMFGKGSNGVGFYWKEPNGKPFTTEAHKAYLVYSPSTASHAKSFLGFDVALGIQTSVVKEKKTVNSPIYNLAGQQVDKDYKGIVIVNGKKYLNR